MCDSKFWISLLIIFYLVLSLSELTGTSNPALSKMATTLRPLTWVLGIDQNWALFSPTVRNINLHNIAVVTFRDGMTKLYEWPRMDRSSRLEQLRNEKYRKMFIDCMPWPPYSDLLPSAARFVARANANPANPPIRVTLSYFWQVLPPAQLQVSQENLPQESNYRCYFVYEVQARDLP